MCTSIYHDYLNIRPESGVSVGFPILNVIVLVTGWICDLETTRAKVVSGLVW